MSLLRLWYPFFAVLTATLFWVPEAICADGSGQNEAAQTAQANANRPIKDKWAVIIGVSQFEDPKIPTLKFPAKDASDFADFLVQKANFKRDHILLLKDKQASRANIVDAFGDGWLPRRVMEDDLVLIFISSHGSPADNAGENFIIAYDSKLDHPYSTSIRLQDLATEVKKRTQCDRLVLLLDACHSGAAVAGQKGLVRNNKNFDLNTVVGTGDLVISSSKPDEVSWESKRYENGVFTHSLINALESNGPKTKIEDAYKVLKDQVQQEVRFDRVTSQTPMMLSKWSGTELSLCLPPSEPRTVRFDDAPPDEVKSNSPPVNFSANQRPPRQGGTGQAPPIQQPLIQQPPVQQQAPIENFQTARADELPNNVRQGRPMRNFKFMTTSWTNNFGDVTLESGTSILRAEELVGLSKDRLTIMYNEAFARHGRGFATSSIQSYYDRQPWYRMDPDYHWRNQDPIVQKRGTTDDALIINQKRTPKQWTNMQIIQRQLRALP